MKQLLFLLLFPCLCVAQYTGNAGQKITLGEQTSADGLVYRGLAADTTRKPSVDTMAYILLDTNTNIIWQYKKAVNNAWRKINLTQSDTSSFNYVNTYGTQTVNGAKTLTSNLILKNSQEPSRATVVTTQTFAADTTNWTLGTGWTFNGTQAVATAATGDLTYTPSLTITSGKAYEITYTVTGYSAGTLTVAFGGGASLALPTHNATANVVLLLPTSATGGFRFTTSTFTGNLDNISVVEISNPAPILFAGQDDGSSTLYSSLRMPNSTTLAFGGGGIRTTGGNNNFMGFFSGNNNTSGSSNNFIGIQSGQFNTSGNNNNFMGFFSGNLNTTGNNNNFMGSESGRRNTTGGNNNFYGNTTGANNTTGSSNNFFGGFAGVANTTGTGNNFYGNQTGVNNTTGNSNNFVGASAGRNNISGNDNNFFGSEAGSNNISGIRNNFFGINAGTVNRSGNNNIAIGTNSFNNTTIADSLTGSDNIGIGNSSAINISGTANGNVVIGNSNNLPIPSGSNQVVIKNIIFATGASGTGTTIAGNVGIAVNTPTARLHLVAGTATASTAPLKFTSGVNLTSPLGGEMEFNGTNLFFSPSTTRHTVNHGLTGSATLNFPSTTTLLSADLTITVTGAADGDVVSLGVPNAAVNANTCYSAWVSAANTVTVRFNNYSSGTVDPASALFKVFVTK